MTAPQLRRPDGTFITDVTLKYIADLEAVAEAARDLIYQRADGLEDIFEHNLELLAAALAVLEEPPA